MLSTFLARRRLARLARTARARTLARSAHAAGFLPGRALARSTRAPEGAFRARFADGTTPPRADAYRARRPAPAVVPGHPAPSTAPSAVVILVAGARDPAHVAGLLGDAGAPGWTILPALGGWTDPAFPGSAPVEEHSYAVLLAGLEPAHVHRIAEALRSALAQSAVYVLPMGIGPMHVVAAPARGVLPAEPLVA